MPIYGNVYRFSIVIATRKKIAFLSLRQTLVISLAISICFQYNCLFN